jgi:hypothetical protein
VISLLLLFDRHQILDHIQLASNDWSYAALLASVLELDATVHISMVSAAQGSQSEILGFSDVLLSRPVPIQKGIFVVAVEMDEFRHYILPICRRSLWSKMVKAWSKGL